MIKTGERRSLWNKYVSIAILDYNICYHTSSDCEPSRVFSGRFRCSILDKKTKIRPQQALLACSQIVQDVFDRTQMICQDLRKNAMQAYIKCKAYYDKKRSTLQNSWKQITYTTYS